MNGTNLKQLSEGATLQLTGESGMTNTPDALKWAASAPKKALNRCREIGSYNEGNSPPRLVVLLSDGENIRVEMTEWRYSYAGVIASSA